MNWLPSEQGCRFATESRLPGHYHRNTRPGPRPSSPNPAAICALPRARTDARCSGSAGLGNLVTRARQPNAASAMTAWCSTIPQLTTSSRRSGWMAGARGRRRDGGCACRPSSATAGCCESMGRALPNSMPSGWFAHRGIAPASTGRRGRSDRGSSWFQWSDSGLLATQGNKSHITVTPVPATAVSRG